MFYLRGLFCCGKDFYFVVVLLCAILILVSCKKCSLNEAESQLDFDTCKPYTGDFLSNSPGVFDGHASSLGSRNSVQQRNLENICPESNSFCFPSTLIGQSFNEVDTGSEAAEAFFHSEGFSSGSKEPRRNLSWPTEHGVFRFLDGKVILCSSYQPDDFHESPSVDINAKDGQQSDVPSCMRTLFDYETHSTKAGENVETVKSGFSGGFSKPPVEIKPFVLDWGKKHLHYPSQAFLTVKNVHRDCVLSIHYPYSSNSQFYPCNFSEILLAPGETESLCFVFFPRKLGLSSTQFVLQTSFGGFVIQAKGFAVKSPYLVKPLNDFDISSNGRWRKNVSLFNPFNEALYVEEITAWISISSGNTSCLSRAICRIHNTEDTNENSMLSAKEWLAVDTPEGCLPEISIRPHKNWEVGSEKTKSLMELDISHFEGKIDGAFCLQLMRSSENKIETVIVPLEADLWQNSDSDKGYVSVSLEALVPCDTSVSAVALSVRNDGPYVLSVVNVKEVGHSIEIFQVKSIEGLVLFPMSVTQVAILSYAHLGTHKVDMDCKLLIQINDTRSSQIEIPCIDVISVCTGRKLDSAFRFAQGISNVDHIKGRGRSSGVGTRPPTEIKAVDTREADEVVLRNWKSQARMSFMSVLDDNKVLFPMVQVGNHSSQWIAVKNPSKEPIVVQLILNSGEVIDNCRRSEMHLQPSLSSILVGNKSIAPTRYGFSIAKDALTEALVHPYGSATFGPILFQPSNRCEWRSSALIRNNLSGVEWLSLQGFGGSLSLVLLEGSDSARSLEFKMNLSQLNFSSPEILQSTAGKRSSCSHPLTKEVHAKNMGDFPLEVVSIKVSGADCGLDGFLVRNCKGFTLPTGESAVLQISYQSDFSSATIQRDLELALATGILVIPMKASLPIYLLNFCKRSLFWMRLKKVMILILLAASLLFFLVCLLFPHVTAFTFHDRKSGKNSCSVSSAVNYLSMRLRRKTVGAMPPKMNGFLESTVGEEALLLGSVSGCPDDQVPDQGHVNSSGNQKLKNSLIDNLRETRLSSSVLSNFSPVEISDMHAESDSRILRVRIEKEKGRRRRKRKSSGVRVPGLFEVSSSQSSNSTPSSPLSPDTFATPKRLWSVHHDTEQSAEVRNPFAQVSDQQCDKRECSEPSSKTNLLKNEVSSEDLSSGCFSAEEPSNLARKFGGRAVLLPSATFPSAGRATSPWTCHSPLVNPMSTIAPHARAPGTKLHNRKTGELGEKTSAEEKFTYNIWGDHLFGLPVVYQSKQPSSVSPHAMENNSESFFVRDPQSLMTNSLLTPVSLDLEGNK